MYVCNIMYHCMYINMYICEFCVYEYDKSVTCNILI